jgi:hypothetical protein
MGDVSLFLAQFWGWYMVIFCLLLIARPKRVVQLLAYLEDEKYLVLTSLISIIIGLLNILLHNIWEANWKVLITIIGWIALTKGIIRFSFPRTALKALNSFNVKWMPYFFAMLFFFGIFLLNKVYLWVSY